MSQGSHKVIFRIDAKLHGELRDEMDLYNEQTCRRPHTWSSFIRQALAEFVAKRRRSRAAAAKKGKVSV